MSQIVTVLLQPSCPLHTEFLKFTSTFGVATVLHKQKVFNSSASFSSNISLKVTRWLPLAATSPSPSLVSSPAILTQAWWTPFTGFGSTPTQEPTSQEFTKTGYKLRPSSHEEPLPHLALPLLSFPRLTPPTPPYPPNTPSSTTLVKNSHIFFPTLSPMTLRHSQPSTTRATQALPRMAKVFWPFAWHRRLHLKQPHQPLLL